MKTKRFLALTSCLATCWALPGYAIEAPADNAPPPAANAQGGPANSAPQARAEVAPAPAAPQAQARAQAAYLGVVCTEIPELLAAHLNLKEGEGILVRALMPGAPAANAGVAVHDVIMRLNDQPVGSSSEFTKQIATHQPGDKIHLDLIRHGKSTALDVTLGVRPNDLADANPMPLDGLKLDGMPQEFADRIRGAIQGNLGGIDLDMQAGPDGMPPQVEEAMREMQQNMQQAMGKFQQPMEPGAGKIEVRQGATIRLMDEQGSVELKSNDGGKEVTVRDKDNKVTWTGPWDTEQDKAAAPEAVRQRVERFNIDNNFNGPGLKLRLRGGPGE